jgi:ribonuclease T2
MRSVVMLYATSLVAAFGVLAMIVATDSDIDTTQSGYQTSFVYPRSDLTATGPKYRINGNNGESINAVARGTCSTDYKFDYLMLDLMWGPGFCATSARKCVVKPPPKQVFTVHGMWPQLNHGEYRGFCCFDNFFLIDEIKSIQKDLNDWWFSYFSLDSTEFWSHEWLKHGTCCKDVESLQGELPYFKTVIDIAQELLFTSALNKSNITPGSGVGNAYHVSDIIEALKHVTNNKTVAINCDKEHHQPIPVLTGLNVCFAKNVTSESLSFIDCAQTKSRCQGQVLFRSW